MKERKNMRIKTCQFMCNREKETGCRPNRHRSLAAKRAYLFRLWDESEIFQNFCLKPAGERRRKKWWKRVNAYQHLDLRDVNRAHYVSSFSVLFVSSLLFSIVLYSLLISLSLLIRSIWISLFSLGKSCCRFSALRWWELRLLNRLTYALCFFRASLLLTRALPVLLLLLLLPMYYRCITRASCILSPSLWCVCVCVYSLSPHARWKEWRCVWKLFKQTMRSFVLSTYTFETVWDTSVQFQIERFFRFFVFLFPSAMA